MRGSLGGAGGGSARLLLLLTLTALALLGLASIYGRSAALGDAGVGANPDDAGGRWLAGSLLRRAAGGDGCATRVLVCAVPPDDFDGAGPSPCRAIDWTHHQQQRNHDTDRALRGGGGAAAAASASSALLTAAAAQSLLAVADPLLAAATANHTMGAPSSSLDLRQHKPHEVFTVRVCPSPSKGVMGVRVLHHRQPRGTCGRAYLEALLDGPARRLGRLAFTGRAVGSSDGVLACEYGGALPVWEAGEYRLEVSAVHTGEAAVGAGAGVEGLEPYRNYVLWSAAHTFHKGRDGGGDGGVGRWVRRRSTEAVGVEEAEGASGSGDGGSGSGSDDREGEEAPGYRCPWGGCGVAGYEWVEGPAERATTGVLPPEAARECVRRLPARANASHPKLVLFGDSFSRQTFNGLARALGMEEVMAIKAFKSMKKGQKWGGAEEGMELSFQWAPYPEARESRERLKALLHDERAHVLVNFGAHPICKGPLDRTLALFDDWLAFVANEVLTTPDVKRRMAWLGTHPRPVAGFHRHHPDHATGVRSLARDAALDAHAKRRMGEVGVRVLDVFDLVNPFRDCTEDGTHHLGGVPKAVATHRVVPWVCELAG